MALLKTRKSITKEKQCSEDKPPASGFFKSGRRQPSREVSHPPVLVLRVSHLDGSNFVRVLLRHRPSRPYTRAG